MQADNQDPQIHKNDDLKAEDPSTITLWELHNPVRVSYLEHFYATDIRKKDKSITVKIDAYTRQKSKYHTEGRYNTKKIVYGFTEGANGYGRMFPKNMTFTLQSMPSEIRKFISGEYYVELDIANCNPTILQCLCKEREYVTPLLDHYCNNRDSILDKYSRELNADRKLVKDTVLQLCFGMGCEKWEHLNRKSLPKYFQSLHKEILDIANRFMKEPDFKPIIDGIKDHFIAKGKKQETNVFSNLAYIITTYENKILQEMVKFMQSKCYNVGALIFDGALIETNGKKIPTNIIKELMEHVKEKTNMAVTICTKPLVSTKYEFDKTKMVTLDKLKKDMNRPMCEFVDKIYDNEEDKKVVNDFYFNEVIRVNDEIEASEYIYGKIGSNFVVCRGDLYKRKGKFFWQLVTSSSDISVEVMRFNIRSVIKDKPITRMSVGISSVTKLLTNILNARCENDRFIDDIWFNSLGKLPYMDGYYDFPNKQFVLWEDNVEKYSFLTYIKCNFPKKSDPEIRKQIRKRVWKAIFPEKTLRKFVRKSLARGMAGCIDDKLWFLFIGERDSGKGVLAECLMQAFKGFVMTTNAENFLVDKSDDMARKLKFLAPCEFARILFTNEMSVSKGSLDGNIPKKICSGGDQITVRKLYANEIVIRIQCMLMLMCNDMPEVSGTDCLQKLNTIFMPSTFVDEDKLGEHTHYKLADSNIKKWLSSQEVIDEFALDLLECYCDKKPEPPDEVKEERAQEREVDDDSWFYEQLEFTDYNKLATDKEKLGYRTSVKEMNMYLKQLSKSRESNMNTKKMKLLLRKKCAQVPYKCDGKSIKCYVGVKIKEYDEC